ncbi:MAG TPA: BON domain-containing protein [bacterium]|nr:BON domain-containing protein [bacterium]
MENLRSNNLIEGPLEEKINSAIKGKGDHLHAFVRDEVVYLSGEVAYHKTKEEISSLVKKIPGIRMITNHIRIKLPEERRRVEHF